MPEIVGPYGDTAEVYESSAAEGPHAWLKVRDESGKEVIGHFTASQLWQLAEQMQDVVRNHYQGDVTPLRDA
jgi:hypothetical protein